MTKTFAYRQRFSFSTTNEEGEKMGEIIPHWLTKQAELSPNRIAIEWEDGRRVTFHQLKTRSQQLARKLANSGVKKGSHVAILSPNSMEMVTAIHALSYLGAVIVLLNIRLTAEELNFQVKDAEVSHLLTDDSMLETGQKLNVNVITSFTMAEKSAEKDVALQEEINLDDPFTIMYTSGTTGFPKGVVHTYGNHWWSAISSALNLGLNQEDKWLIPLPLFHVSGLSTLLKGIIYGMPVHLFVKFDERRVHEAIMTKGITIISVVTVMLQRWLHIMEEGERPDKLRCALLGGGPAPKSLLEKAKKRNIPVFQSYGMTETSSQIATLSPTDALRKLGSAGKPLFPAQLRIDKKDNEKIGEIVVKGPMVTKGYYNRDDANRDAFTDGWLKTGDLGYLDEDGYLYVVDRRKDLIISGGENIYPSEIEGVLSGMEQIKEVGVAGKGDPDWGQVPVAFVVPRGKIAKEEIYRFLQQKLAKYKWPKEIYFVDALPRNAANKLVRHKLLDLIDQT